MEPGPARVLIVDDEADVRSSLRSVLETDGHRVIEAAGGEEALRELGRARPRLVLLDLRMPNMDGFAVAEAIRRWPGMFVPVILLTAADDPASRARAIAAGADEVLIKPVTPFELKLRVRAMLRIQHLTSELQAANRRLRLLVVTDELTGVRNRRGLRALMVREFHRAERYQGKLALLLFDIDRFKVVNDTHGHAVGDRVLRAVAQALQGALRQVDVVGRLGGEEFVVVAPETSLEEARLVADRLRAQVARVEVAVPSGEPVRVTVSCGVAACDPVLPSDADELLAIADAALYRAKALGRNRTESSIGADPPAPVITSGPGSA